MATDSPSLPPALNDARQQAGRFWQSRAPRERQLIVVMVVSVAILAVWLILIQPALRILRDAPVELDRLDQQMQQMQLAASEMQGLRAASPVPTEQASTALRAATSQLGSSAKLSIQGDRAILTFTAIQGDALRGWLNEARSAARARPMEAQLVKAATGYTGSITVSLGGGS